MKSALRIILLIALVAQAWHAVVLTRYERLYQAGQLSYNAWDAEGALAYFNEAREVADGDSDVWRRSGDMALYIHDFPGQVQEAHDPREMLEHAAEGYAGAVLRCPVDSWSWTGIAEVALNRAILEEKNEGLDLGALERRGQGVYGPFRAAALAAASLAVRLKPAGFQELDVLAAVYESMGRAEEAERTIVESATMMPVASFHVWGQGKRLRRDLYLAIMRGLEEGIARAPAFERSLLHREIAGFARGQGDYETGVVHANLAAETADRPYEVYAANWELARSLEGLGRFDEAVTAVKTARSNLPDPSTLSRRLGTLELRIGRVEDACVTLREALRNAADDAGLRVQAARACEMAGEIEVAAGILQDGFVVPTENPVLAGALLDLYRRNQRGGLASFHLERWTTQYGDRLELPDASRVGQP